MKVGDTIWEYRDWGKRKWVPRIITGETSRSWLIGDAPHSRFVTRVPKKGSHHGWAFSAQAISDFQWENDYSWLIGDAVRRCQDVAKLRQIADLIGWAEPQGER